MKITMDKKFEVLKTIEQHGLSESYGAETFWAYDDGWNDARVAKQCRVPTQSVNRWRGLVFGKIANVQSDNIAIAALLRRVEELEHDVRKLQNPIQSTLLETTSTRPSVAMNGAK